MAAVDSPIESQTMPLTVDLQDCYKDPTRFRYSAMERPMIQPAKPAHFLQGEHEGVKMQKNIHCTLPTSI